MVPKTDRTQQKQNIKVNTTTNGKSESAKTGYDKRSTKQKGKGGLSVTGPRPVRVELSLTGGACFSSFVF